MHLVDRGSNGASKAVYHTFTRFYLIFLTRPKVQLKVRLRDSLFVKILPKIIIGFICFHLWKTLIKSLINHHSCTLRQRCYPLVLKQLLTFHCRALPCIIAALFVEVIWLGTCMGSVVVVGVFRLVEMFVFRILHMMCGY